MPTIGSDGTDIARAIAVDNEGNAYVTGESQGGGGGQGALYRRAAIVPLRWGSPRIVVLSGGIRFHLGHDLSHEPFRAARLWRYRWDPATDLAVSRRAPDKLAIFATHNPTVDELIERTVAGTVAALIIGMSAHAS